MACKLSTRAFISPYLEYRNSHDERSSGYGRNGVIYYVSNTILFRKVDVHIPIKWGLRLNEEFQVI